MTNAGTPKAPDQDFAGMVDRFETAVIEGSVALAALLSGRRQGTKPEEAEIEAARSALLARYEEMRADAERWRALMSSARMHFMGSSGFAMKDDAAPAPRPGEVWHFGMEFWSEHTAAGKDGFERRMITNYVDALRARTVTRTGDR